MLGFKRKFLHVSSLKTFANTFSGPRLLLVVFDGIGQLTIDKLVSESWPTGILRRNEQKGALIAGVFFLPIPPPPPLLFNAAPATSCYAAQAKVL